MHLLESFALSTGTKIEKPYIYTTYTPLPLETEKYISFQPWGQKEFDARIYPYWGEVLDILRPSLNEKNIPVIQLGVKDEDKVQGTIDMRGKTSINQAAYVIKNATLHLGIDSFGVHVASGFGKKIVALYSNMLPSQSGPYWSDSKDVKIISSLEEEERASYCMVEEPKTLLRIPPERIAKAVAELLELKLDYPFETVGTGEDYQYRRLEIIPRNFVQNWKEFQLDSAIMRMDKAHQEDMLIQQLQVCPCSVVTRRPIDPRIIAQFKDKIVEMIYYIDSSTDLNYISQLKNSGVSLFLLCDLEDKEFNKLKLDYIDIAPIIHQKKTTKKEVFKKYNIKDTKNLFYKSSTTVVTENGLFSDYVNAELNKNHLNNHRFMDPLPVIDTPEFWEDASRMTFLVKKG